MAIFFTSDSHFGHANVIQYSGRPFTGTDHMREVLIARWNERVQSQDTVYHLGDLFLCSQEAAQKIRARLNGSICLILGNHDKTASSLPHLFEWVKDMYYLRYEGRRIMLCHYAMRTWRNSSHGSWHLYGHSHGNMPGIGYSMDVGVDCHDFYPISFAQVEVAMLAKGPGLNINHHSSRR